MKAFLIFFLFASNCVASILGEDNRSPVNKTSFPFSSVGRLETPENNHCTASLVTSSKVLTAKHCVEGFYGQEKQFGIQFHGSTKTYRFMDIEVGESDTAYLILTEKITEITPLKISTARATKVLNLGYPFDLENGLSLHEETCEVRFSEHGFLITDCDLMRGQSGGPLLNSHNEIVGINSFQSCGDLSHSYAPKFTKHCYSAGAIP